MKKISALLVSAAAFTAFATPAFAAAPVGGRIEAIVGYDRGSIDLNDVGFDENIDRSGVVFGVGAGYDFAVGTGTSFGIDLEASDSTTDFNFDDGIDSAELRFGRDLYAGARLSFPVSETANVYIKGGYTNLKVGATVDSGGVVIDDTGKADGARGGIGAQFGLGTSAYVGAEYRYSNYEGDLIRHQAVASLGFRF